MECSSGERLSELEFVNRVAARTDPSCVGPLVKLGFSPGHLDLLEQSLQNREAFEYVLAGYVDEGDRLYFGLCVLHWMDVSHICWRNSQRVNFVDGLWISQQVLDGACQGGGVDPKEIANMFVWRRVTLT